MGKKKKGEKVNVVRSEAEVAARMNVARRFCLPCDKLISIYIHTRIFLLCFPKVILDVQIL